MPDSTSNDGFDWSSLLGNSNFWNAIAGIYGIKQSQKPPKFYQVPETPMQTWANNARQSLFNSDPARNYVSQYASQFLNGIKDLNPPNFTLHNSRNGDSPFMGGVKVPTFDPSKFPDLSKPPNGGVTGTTSAPTGQQTTPQQQLPPALSGGADPFQSMSAPTGQNPTDWDTLKQWASKYGKPGTQILGGIISGNPGLAFTGIWNLFKVWTQGDGQQHYTGNPNPNNAQWTTPNTPGSGITDPNARTNWTPGQGPGYEGFWNQQDSNLRNGPGGGPSGLNQLPWGKYKP